MYLGPQLISHPELGNLLKVAPWLQIEEMTQIIVASNHHSSKLSMRE
jgi:hypothetical protein